MKEEVNVELLNEVIISKERGKFTDRLSELVLSVVKSEINGERYKFILPEFREDCIVFGYLA